MFRFRTPDSEKVLELNENGHLLPNGSYQKGRFGNLIKKYVKLERYALCSSESLVWMPHLLFWVDLHVFPQHNHVHDSGITQMYSYIYNLHNDFRIDGTQLSVTKNIVMHHLRYNSTVIAA